MEPASPVNGQDLPAYAPHDLTVTEAHPQPAPGSDREALVLASRARVAAAQTAMTGALDGYLTRLEGVVLSRVKGPRARKGTRWWGESAKNLYAPATGGVELETKALDATYALPDKLVAEVGDAARPVALRVAHDAALATARALGVRVPEHGDPDEAGFAVDHDALNAAVDRAVARVRDVATHHAKLVRQAIEQADGSAETLDEMLDRISHAHQKGSTWVRMAGAAVTNGLIQDVSVAQARALGVTHAQWLSRRDEHVRPAHARADGQVRELGTPFRVGEADLAHPCDPAGLPETWPEVAGCRCGLLFRAPSADHARALGTLSGTRPGLGGPGALALLATVAGGGAAVHAVAAPIGVSSGPDGQPPAARQVTTTESVVGYRALEHAAAVTSGQWIMMSGPIVLGLAAPVLFAEGAPVLSVLIPAHTTLTVAGGMVVLPSGQPLEVLSVSPTGVQTQAVATG